MLCLSPLSGCDTESSLSHEGEWTYNTLLCHAKTCARTYRARTLRFVQQGAFSSRGSDRGMVAMRCDLPLCKRRNLTSRMMPIHIRFTHGLSYYRDWTRKYGSTTSHWSSGGQVRLRNPDGTPVAWYCEFCAMGHAVVFRPHRPKCLRAFCPYSPAMWVYSEMALKKRLPA